VHPVAVGFGLGFLVAVQLGPMSLFLIRSTLRRGWMVGLAVGAGIAVIDGVYATLGAAGAVPLLEIGPLRVVLGLVGAVVIAILGLRTLWSAFRVRSGGELDIEVSGPRRAFLTSLAGTASNPATIVSWAAIFAAASAGGTGRSAGAAALLVTGVALGSATWVTALASGTAVVRHAIGPRAMRIADAVAGVGLLGFAGALAYGTVNDR
jgi:threonine/homoserine/homoserine lactone efflux protein